LRNVDWPAMEELRLVIPQEDFGDQVQATLDTPHVVWISSDKRHGVNENMAYDQNYVDDEGRTISILWFRLYNTPGDDPEYKTFSQLFYRTIEIRIGFRQETVSWWTVLFVEFEEGDLTPYGI
jgi:hypothetical protein